MNVNELGLKVGSIVEFAEGDKYLVSRELSGSKGRKFRLCALDDGVLHGTFSTLDEILETCPVVKIFNNNELVLGEGIEREINPKVENPECSIKLGSVVESHEGTKYLIVRRIERGYGACSLDNYVVHGNYSTLDKLESVMTSLTKTVFESLETYFKEVGNE